MYISYLKKTHFKCTSGATAIEYGLVVALISVAIAGAVWTTGQESSNNVMRIANTMDNSNNAMNTSNRTENRQYLLDRFYDLTGEEGCNGFGSCGSTGNQGIWEAFKDIAMSNTAFDDLLVDRNSFEVGIFAEARLQTQAKMKELGVSGSFHRTIDGTTVRQEAQKIWLELAAEQGTSE